MLEELGLPYELRYVDLRTGEQRSPDHQARNRMTKIPVLQDGEATISETAAIGVYLADRYASGRLAPALDAAERGAYLRWCFFAPSVLEPACMAKSSGWTFTPGQAGFGTYENVVATLEEALAEGPWLAGETFSMADIIVGATVRWMVKFNMLERGEHIGAYADRLGERPALGRADAINAGIVAERGITMG